MGDRAPKLAIEMDAVDRQPFISAQMIETRSGIGIDGPFANMHVHTNVEILGKTGGSFECLVSTRERGVYADHPAPTRLEVPLTLGEAPTSLIGHFFWSWSRGGRLRSDRYAC